MSDIALKYNTAAEAFDFVLGRDKPVSYAPELIPDGEFNTDLGLWTAHNPVNAELSIDVGKLKIVQKVGAVATPMAFREFPVIVGRNYEVRVDMFPGLTSVLLIIDSTPNFAGASLVLLSSTQQTMVGSFQASFTGSYWVYLLPQTFLIGNYCWFDNVSIKDMVIGETVFQSTRFADDNGLESAVILSLYCDRLANKDDNLPDGTKNRRGWWADAHARVEGDFVGSRLWLIDREKVQQSVLLRAREYAREALQWLIDDGVARSIDVQASTVSTNILGLDITIARRDGGIFRKLWEFQLRPR